MSTYKIEIEKRHAARRAIMKDSRRPLKVVITDAESVKELKSLIGKQQADLLDKCFLVDHDFNVMLRAFDMIEKEFPAVNVGNYIGRAWESAPLSEEEQQVLYDRIVKEGEEKEKQDVKNGKVPEIPGQQKLFDPKTMPDAEAAGPVVVSRLEVVQ